MPSLLFSPLTIRSTTIRNRVWASPMCQYSAGPDGIPVDWHLMNLGQFAAGGAGLVVTEAAAVVPEGRITPQDVGIWNGRQADAFARIVALIRSQGAVAGIQLAHAGRKASTYRPWASEQGTVPVPDGGWRTVGPSAVPFEGYDEPRAMSIAEVEATVEAFRDAAKRAVEIGFGVLEIHAAHGYLLHQFLSPLSNVRTDAYGGDLRGRARLLLEIVAGIRADLPDVPLFVRVSATDWTDGGLTVEDVAQVAGWASEAGADLIDVSTGGNVLANIPVGPGYQVPFAEQIRRDAGVAVNAVGIITTGEQAEQVLQDGKADAIMLARELIRDPHFALRAAQQLGDEIDYWPKQYERARPFRF